MKEGIIPYFDNIYDARERERDRQTDRERELPSSGLLRSKYW
jgi:hypothetical protein